MKAFLFTILLFLCPKILFGMAPDSLKIKNDDVKIYPKRLTSPIHIDGKLIEPVRQQIDGFDGFIQSEPIEGVLASERTVVKIVYDDNALYVGARMFDSSPDSIIARLSRRDNLEESDFFAIGLDPYHDKRSGYFFVVNAAGVLIDGVLFNDTNDDDSWNAVWEGEAVIDGLGWTAEMRIPFSQLKFNKSNLNVRGINYRRTIARKNESDYLVFIPKTENVFVSHFAELHGMNDLVPPNQIEIFPYVTVRAEYIKTEDGNPFNDGSNYVPGAGLDLKMSVGTGLTLNVTINPDFGQVEIDPAVINLSDVEVFFPERRPFFIEGSSIFDFGRGGAQNYWGFNWGNPDFFYSRRIGGDPQGSIPDADYTDYPTGTHIIGAAKLTGKIGNTWNFGTIQSLTKREYARWHTDGIESRAEVEPLAYYGVIRAQKEFNEGNQGLGVISTMALRDFNEPQLEDEFNRGSFSIGLDGWTFLGSSRSWVLAGWTRLSNVRGNSQQILNIQENSLHYFQKPDADHVSVDSSAESLTGLSGRVVLNKEKGNFFC